MDTEQSNNLNHNSFDDENDTIEFEIDDSDDTLSENSNDTESQNEQEPQVKNLHQEKLDEGKQSEDETIEGKNNKEDKKKEKILPNWNDIKPITKNDLRVKNRKEFLSKYLQVYDTRSPKCTDCITTRTMYHYNEGGSFKQCTLCFVKDNALSEKIKETVLNDIQKIKCPECVKKYGYKPNLPENETVITKFGTEVFRSRKYKGRRLQKYKCACNHSFVFEKLYDDLVDKENALVMYYEGMTILNISRMLKRTSYQIKVWLIEWVNENYPDRIRERTTPKRKTHKRASKKPIS